MDHRVRKMTKFRCSYLFVASFREICRRPRSAAEGSAEAPETTPYDALQTASNHRSERSADAPETTPWDALQPPPETRLTTLFEHPSQRSPNTPHDALQTPLRRPENAASGRSQDVLETRSRRPADAPESPLRAVCRRPRSAAGTARQVPRTTCGRSRPHACARSPARQAPRAARGPAPGTRETGERVGYEP